MNKVAHGLVAAAFGAACCGLWAILLMVERTAFLHLEGSPLPAFARLCFEFRPFLLWLPAIAAACCVFVWLRKADGQKSWMAFFGGSMYALVLLAFPVAIAGWIVLVQIIEVLAKR